jgi:hypothetical protein
LFLHQPFLEPHNTFGADASGVVFMLLVQVG